MHNTTGEYLVHKRDKSLKTTKKIGYDTVSIKHIINSLLECIYFITWILFSFLWWSHFNQLLHCVGGLLGCVSFYLLSWIMHQNILSFTENCRPWIYGENIIIYYYVGRPNFSNHCHVLSNQLHTFHMKLWKCIYKLIDWNIYYMYKHVQHVYWWITNVHLLWCSSFIHRIYTLSKLNVTEQDGKKVRGLDDTAFRNARNGKVSH